MFSGTGKVRSAAWRISLGGTLVFACGSLLVFLFVAQFVARDMERRTNVWLSGEMENLRDMASRTPPERLSHRLLTEAQEISREVPGTARSQNGRSDQVFFLQIANDGTPAVWQGPWEPGEVAEALRGLPFQPAANVPFDLQVRDAETSFRAVTVPLVDGSRIYLGLSAKDQSRVLRNLRLRFLELWVLNVALGFAILFWISRRMLGDVRRITEAASRIGETDLSARVPMSDKQDEAAQLAGTLNRMFERIEVSMQQVHTMSGALAHDLRSPLTAIRAKLEMALPMDGQGGVESDEVVSAIDEIDRLTELLTKSLDVAEAKADALRLKRELVDLNAVLRSMEELYGPSFAESGLRLEVESAGAVWVLMDAALLHRMMANLFDNELKHLHAGCVVRFVLENDSEMAVLRVEDDGPGFAEQVRTRMFEARVKGKGSSGYGLGLAFVQAVVASHGGMIDAGNERGAWIVARLPLAAA